MLDTDRRSNPRLPRDGCRDGVEVEPVGRKDLTLLVGEETVDPVPAALAGVLAPHANVLQSVRASGKSVTIEELAQGARVALIDPLVRIEGEDPIRPKLGRGREQSVPVAPVVPTPVAAPSGIGKEDPDQWAGGEQVTRVIGAAVIERNDRVADQRRRGEVVGNVLSRVADREQADDAASAAPPPVRS
jgi:hypothetical protein